VPRSPASLPAMDTAMGCAEPEDRIGSLRLQRVSSERKHYLRVLGDPCGDLWPCEHNGPGAQAEDCLCDLDGALGEQLSLGVRCGLESGPIEQDQELIPCVYEGGVLRGLVAHFIDFIYAMQQ
jgi:hypothetical protein